ncbi:PaaI family thioesterase [bacterium]|jgi:uncharacterized protein (TIGR00369 family)|nr:PaaI family thioesterase [bacterium]
MNIEERTQHMREQPLFQGMGFSKIIEFSKEESSIKIEYIAEHRHCHSGNIVQGGYVTGWIDSAMAHSVMIPTNFEFSPLTLELKITFFKSANPGPVIAEAKVIKLGKSIAFVEGSLFSEKGILIAKGTSTNKLVPMPEQ